MDLSFLSDIKLEPVSKAKAKVEIVKLPGDDAHIRVFGSGKVFPSKAFALGGALEFVPKAVVLEGSKPEVIGNGFDIFSSEEWGMLQGKLPQPVLFCYVIPKSYAKVDLWANTKYAEDGTPKASVFTQGTSVFSKGQLLKIISEAYEIDWNKVDYVDMVILVDQPVVHPLGIYDIPKIVSGGAKKGTITHIRRQNVTVCPLVIKHTEFLKIPKTPSEAPVLEKGTPFDEKVETPEQVIHTAMGVPEEMIGKEEPIANIEVKDPVTFEGAEEGKVMPTPSAENPTIPGSAIPPNPLFNSVEKAGESVSKESGQIAPEKLGVVDTDKAITPPSAANWAAGLGNKID